MRIVIGQVSEAINQLRQMIPLSLTPIKLYFREKSGKINFSGNTREFERIKKKKRKITTKKQKQRKEQSRKKRERDSKPNL